MKRAWAIESRRLARSTPAAYRLGWRALLVSARELAAGDGGVHAPGAARRVSFETRLADFRHLLREARADLFPVEAASVAWFTEGFVRVGRAFGEAEMSEIRAAIGPALLACADGLLQILDDARDAAASEHNRRLMGEKDD